ncbi:MAG: DUF342 domain-containing protein [Lachnospiraceae bacterium]|nr:DUF342 domain-containing protein [Lachnospiraceae bacterium]
MQTEKNEQDWSQGVWKQIQKGDLQGMDLRSYARKGYDSNIIKQIRLARAGGIDMEEYVEEGYDREQLREIRVAIREGVELEPYLSKGCCGAQLRQIRKGLKNFVDVGLYADIRYNWMQMYEIRIGLENRIDASVYANPFYSRAQMREIRLGLEEGIDVSSYARLIYSRTDMVEKRKKLTEKCYAAGAERADINIKDEVTGMNIRLTGNRLEAWITLPKDHRKLHLTVDYVIQILKQNDIVYGIDRASIAQALEKGQFEGEILAARGKEPGRGESGKYEFYFNTEPSRKPVELEDGRVDYQNVDIFEEVAQNQVIARYVSAGYGAAGMSVQGISIPGRKGKELSVLQGKGFYLKEDGVTYVSAIQGIIEYKKEEIHIYEELIVREDVGVSYGNIHFHGCIHIYGNVGPNVEIQAEGGISIEGNVEASSIRSGGDVLIKKGVAGSGKGVIHAEGSIAGNFFEACELQAGRNVEAGYLMNSETSAGEKVKIIGRKGSVIGGRTRGIYGIEANQIGNRSQILTDIGTGVGKEALMELQRCQEEYDEIQSNLLVVANKMKRYSDQEKNTSIYRRLLSERLGLKEQAENIRNRRRQIQMVLTANSDIKVLSRAYAGTRITIGRVTRELEEDYRMTTFSLVDKEIINK